MGIPEPIVHTTLIFMAIVAAFCVMQLFLRCLGVRPPASRGRRALHQHTSRRSAAKTTPPSRSSSTLWLDSAAGCSGCARGCTSGTRCCVRSTRARAAASRRRRASARTSCRRPPKYSVIYGGAGAAGRVGANAPRCPSPAREGLAPHYLARRLSPISRFPWRGSDTPAGAQTP